MTSPMLVCKDTALRPIDLEKIHPIIVNDFNEKSTTDFYKEFSKLLLEPDLTVVPILVNSYGGSTYALFAMLDIMATSNRPVATIGLGKAMSCGAVLLAAGTKGYRFASPTVDILIHEVSSAATGKNTDIQNEAKSVDRTNKILLERLTKFCGKKPKYFVDMIKENGNADLYLTAREAKKIGLVDHIGMPMILER